MFKRPSIPSLKCDFECLKTLHRKQFCLWREFVLFLTQNLSKIFNTKFFQQKFFNSGNRSMNGKTLSVDCNLPQFLQDG